MFRLPKDAKEWFKKISGSFNLDFDIYYFCLMAGLAKGKKESFPATETSDLINRFPQEYRAESKIITSLFLKKELDKMGVSLKDRKAVHETIRRYIDSSYPSGFSDEGQREINKYANGGLEVLKEHFGDEPVTIEGFLLRFAQLIDDINTEVKVS